MEPRSGTIITEPATQPATQPCTYLDISAISTMLCVIMSVPPIMSVPTYYFVLVCPHILCLSPPIVTHHFLADKPFLNLECGTSSPACFLIAVTSSPVNLRTYLDLLVLLFNDKIYTDNYKGCIRGSEEKIGIRGVHIRKQHLVFKWSALVSFKRLWAPKWV